MKLCICRDISDKVFKNHLTESAAHVEDAEAALAQCSGEPTNCGKCLDMAEEIALMHNKRVATVRSLGTSLPALARETV